MAITHPFGKPEEAKRSDVPAGQPATPSVQKEMAKTGRQPGDGVGDSPGTAKVQVIDRSVNDSINPNSKAPSGHNKDVWAQAEASALNGGGFAGLDEKAKNDLIQGQYDQMVKNDQATKDWAGGVGNTVLGDTK